MKVQSSEKIDNAQVGNDQVGEDIWELVQQASAAQTVKEEQRVQQEKRRQLLSVVWSGMITMINEILGPTALGTTLLIIVLVFFVFGGR
jgi:hypothetical protein